MRLKEGKKSRVVLKLCKTSISNGQLQPADCGTTEIEWKESNVGQNSVQDLFIQLLFCGFCPTGFTVVVEQTKT